MQIVEWYDELLRLTDSPVVRLNRAVAVGEADGPQAGLAALADVDPDLPRYAAVAAYLHERAGDLDARRRAVRRGLPRRDQRAGARPPHPRGRAGAAAAASVSAATGCGPRPASGVLACGGMAIRAVVFDIGGVLEITPAMDFDARWENDLGLPTGTVFQRLGDVFAAGSLGEVTEAEVLEAVRDRLEVGPEKADEMMAIVWEQYLGTANTELIAWARRLRPRPQDRHPEQQLRGGA